MLLAQTADKLGERFAGAKNPVKNVVASNHPAANFMFWRPLLLMERVFGVSRHQKSQVPDLAGASILMTDRGSSHARLFW
jgi:hypothetical protein